MFSTRSTKGMPPVLVLAALGLAGCASMSNAEKGAVAGGATGAVVGAAVGKAAGSTAKGAILGAVVGGTAGAVIGRRMDRQAEALAQELPDAEVERVGEGIQVTFDSGILFGFDSAQLQTAARAHLTRLAASLHRDQDTDILIVGHTDALGSDEYNKGLSERRAQSARDYLLMQGLNVRRIEVVGRGEAEPVADNDSDAGRRENRRVEIAIYASEEYRTRLASGS